MLKTAWYQPLKQSKFVVKMRSLILLLMGKPQDIENGVSSAGVPKLASTAKDVEFPMPQSGVNLHQICQAAPTNSVETLLGETALFEHGYSPPKTSRRARSVGGRPITPKRKPYSGNSKFVSPAKSRPSPVKEVIKPVSKIAKNT